MGLTGHIRRNRLFYKPALRIIGEIPSPGGVRDRKGAVDPNYT